MTNRPDKLSIVIHSGAFDRVHYALVMAAAAAALDIPVTLFFTMWGCRALTRPAPDGTPGWHGMSVGEPGLTAAALDARFMERQVAGFEELLRACADLGVRFLVCESGLLGAGLAQDHLRDDLPVEVGSAVGFLHDASSTGITMFV